MPLGTDPSKLSAASNHRTMTYLRGNSAGWRLTSQGNGPMVLWVGAGRAVLRQSLRGSGRDRSRVWGKSYFAGNRSIHRERGFDIDEQGKARVRPTHGPGGPPPADTDPTSKP